VEKTRNMSIKYKGYTVSHANDPPPPQETELELEFDTDQTEPDQ